MHTTFISVKFIIVCHYCGVSGIFQSVMCCKTLGSYIFLQCYTWIPLIDIWARRVEKIQYGSDQQREAERNDVPLLSEHNIYSPTSAFIIECSPQQPQHKSEVKESPPPGWYQLTLQLFCRHKQLLYSILTLIFTLQSFSWKGVLVSLKSKEIMMSTSLASLSTGRPCLVYLNWSVEAISLLFDLSALSSSLPLSLSVWEACHRAECNIKRLTSRGPPDNTGYSLSFILFFVSLL